MHPFFGATATQIGVDLQLRLLLSLSGAPLSLLSGPPSFDLAALSLLFFLHLLLLLHLLLDVPVSVTLFVRPQPRSSFEKRRAELGLADRKDLVVYPLDVLTEDRPVWRRVRMVGISTHESNGVIQNQFVLLLGTLSLLLLFRTERLRLRIKRSLRLDSSIVLPSRSFMLVMQRFPLLHLLVGSRRRLWLANIVKYRR